MIKELPKSVTDNSGSSKDLRLIATTLNEVIAKININERKQKSMFNTFYGMSVNNNFDEIEKLKKEVEFLSKENYNLIHDISEIGGILELEGGSTNSIKNQIIKKYFSLKKENERLKSNINELKEYIESNTFSVFDPESNLYEDMINKDKVLEIINKGVHNVKD